MIKLAYGRNRSQVGDLHLPDGPGPHPVVIVLHGGFWRAQYGRWIMRTLADDLAARGYAAWNLEYRRVGLMSGGGFPNTLDDVAAGVDHLETVAADHALDLDRVAVLGHSAGGHLALWVAGRGAVARVVPSIAIAQAGVADLRLAFDLRLGNGAVDDFMGGSPADHPDRYRAASPAERVPTGVKQVLVHGTRDEHVPIEVARAYAASARAANDDVELVEIEGDHMVLIDTAADAWREVVNRLP